jgi:integrase/recombinase XerD
LTVKTHIIEENDLKQSPVLNEKQVKRVLNSSKMTKYGDRNRLVMVLSYYVGLRSCEICSLTVGDVIDGDGNIKEQVILKSNQTKGNKCNSIYFSGFVRDEIGNYLSKYSRLKERTTERLIQSQKGGGFSSQTLQNLFKHLYKSVGLDDCSSHSGRRTFITTLSERGISVRVIQELARHSDLGTTQRYIDVSVDKLKNAVETVSY